MRRYILLFIIVLLFVPQAALSDEAKDALALFYKANALYEKGDYAKAVEGYIAILDMGLGSGNVHYNMGNGFLKLGKIGHTILCYERAKIFMPGDSDLKANLNYAKSLVEGSDLQPSSRFILIRMVERLFSDYSLNTIAIIGAILYALVILVSAVNIINPIFIKRSRLLLLITLAAFLLDSSAFAIRYYDEEILRYGIVIQEEVDAKYEPIDKSTTYYRLHEGNKAIVLQTRNGWRQIKRLDNKIAWIKKEALEEI
ncbi:MAG: hypothetical protein HZA30_00125 [Candidatus Omnitrophica bacterium]|nr:hypothetical protein [Candidatus Omnitrophota bacterium]MBI5143460.1 hypothetical protein [Candidatus Omnitrophota bacterium]